MNCSRAAGLPGMRTFYSKLNYSRNLIKRRLAQSFSPTFSINPPCNITEQTCNWKLQLSRAKKYNTKCKEIFFLIKSHLADRLHLPPIIFRNFLGFFILLMIIFRKIPYSTAYPTGISSVNTLFCQFLPINDVLVLPLLVTFLLRTLLFLFLHNQSSPLEPLAALL